MNTKVEPLVYRIPIVNSAFFGACVYVCVWAGGGWSLLSLSLHVYKKTSIRGHLSFHTWPPFYGAEAIVIIQVV